MANNSSLSSASNSFDFGTQNGVMHVLASVRSSDISPDKKNELRDLIFLYSNGGHDHSVRHSLEQKLTQFAVVALPKPAVVQPAKVHIIGTSRPSPAFKPAPVPEKTPEASSEMVVTESEPQVTPTTPTTQTPATQPVTKSTPVDILDNLPQEKVVVEVEVKPAEPVVTELLTKSPSSSADSLQRIKEIKALVNKKVGNPVNLVNINNEVGREYMGALLDAMKKINSGSSAASAMQRLESAYLSVEEALKNQPEAEQVAKPVENDTPEEQNQDRFDPVSKQETASVPVPQPQTQSVSVSTSPIQPVPVPEKQSQEPVEASAALTSKPSPISTGQARSIAAETKMDSRPLAPLAQSEKRETIQTEPPTELPKPIAAPQLAIPQEQSQSEASSAWGLQTDTLSEIKTVDKSLETASVAVKYQPASLAQSGTKLQTPEDLPKEVSSVAGNPLYTMQVDDGLNQLLTDWVLFKKSGLFGTGPKGSSHPLYLKVKDLQIPLLLAGRFEGATQEVKQSITDYMNGWRYEQGIVYEQGESFDHYLRRVIHHILDLHKKA
jgi:hypothetical protein